MSILQQFLGQFANGEFTLGFIEAAFLALVIGLIGRLLLYARRRIRLFFGPSTAIVTSPSASSRLGGCIESALLLVLFVAVAGVLLLWLGMH